jgi:predicted dehydrogenase
MDPVKVGIVGCGDVSRQYFKSAPLFPILDVVACADLDLDRAKKQAQTFGIAHACRPEELLARDDIQIVVNLTIPAAHHEIALATLASGKHAYSEKPLAISAAQGRQILDLATQKGLRVGCAPDTFLGTSHQTCRKLIEQGAIGRPVAVTAYMMGSGHESWHPSPAFFYEPGGGPMFDMGPYYLTAIINLLGPIARVCGITGVQIPVRTITSEPLKGQTIEVQTPDHFSGALQLKQGAIGTIITSFAVRGAADTNCITVFGTEGTLKVPDPNAFDKSVRLSRDGKDWQEVAVEHRHPNGRGLGVADLAHAIRSGRPHRASGEQAYCVLQAMEGFRVSSETGQYCELDTDFTRPALMPVDLAGGVLDD